MQIRPVRPHEHAELGALTLAAYEALPGRPLNARYAAELAAVGERAAVAPVLLAADAEGGEGPLLGGVTYVPDRTNRSY
ncbi:MAG: hypothetical protein ACYDDZ_13420 [Acidimicrobiales bacterium]